MWRGPEAPGCRAAENALRCAAAKSYRHGNHCRPLQTLDTGISLEDAVEKTFEGFLSCEQMTSSTTYTCNLSFSKVTQSILTALSWTIWEMPENAFIKILQISDVQISHLYL